MSFFAYVLSKGVTLCFLGMGGILAAVFLMWTGAVPDMILLAELLLAVLTALWLVCTYVVWQVRWKRLCRRKDQLEEKYLLGEVLPRPGDGMEREYFEMMKTISHSALTQLEKSRKEKQEYCDYVESWIHEIRTPLTACSLILDNDGDPAKLRRELKRAENLTESILYYAKIRMVQKENQIQQVQIQEAAHEAVKSQMHLLMAARIQVEIQGDFQVFTDRKIIIFILKQLLINCAKYCPDCKITITACQGRLQVRDNGAGIAAHELPKIMDRGYTGEAGRRLGGSTGMGLYIVKELCGELGISLEIRSKEGEYTCVCLDFGPSCEVGGTLQKC